MVDIKIKNVTKTYGKTIAINDINLTIKDGELFILLGPSGCGKTTTLFSIAGLIKPDSGEIIFGREVIFSADDKKFERPQDRNLAMVFQDYAIYPHMTVFKNIAFPLEIRKQKKEEIEARVSKAAKRLEIDQLLDRKPKQLSGGQRQRVALARAIVREPTAFLMDEPLSNLDAKLRVYARAELKRLHKRLETTIIYVTHDQLEAMSIGDKIAILNNGILEQVDTPDNIYNSPKNIFVAGFIGSPPMNMLDGIIKQSNGQTFVKFNEINFKLPTRFTKVINPDLDEVVLGIRPEDIDISENSSENSIKAKIDIVELMGREVYVHMKINNNTLIAITKPSHALKTGIEVYLTFNDQKIHLFNKETQENMIQLKKNE